jgi:hypothetical protein
VNPLSPDLPEAYDLPIGDQLSLFIDEHRGMLARSLDGLTEVEARRELVPSSTTMLGLVKHATFVERVWFEEAIDGRPRSESGIAAGPEESFVLEDDDTIESVLADYRDAVEHARHVTERMGLAAVVTGNRRGELPMRWIQLHVLRELAQHCGHADVLREQLMAMRRDRHPER